MVRFHLTALDIHPTIIARNLVYLFLLDQLVDGQSITPETRAEIVATYMYAFIGVVMPDYCHKRWALKSLCSPPRNSIQIFRVMAILDDLCNRLSESPPRVPSWIFVPTTSIPPILDAINYWIDAAKTTETGRALELHEIPDPSAPRLEGIGISGPALPPGNMPDDLTLELASINLESMTGQQLVETGLLPVHIFPNQARQYFERHKSQIAKAMKERMISGIPTAETNIDIKWYMMTKTLPIPKELEARHTVLKRLLDVVRRGKDIPRTLITKVDRYPVSEGSLTRPPIGTTGDRNDVEAQHYAICMLSPPTPTHF